MNRVVDLSGRRSEPPNPRPRWWGSESSIAICATLGLGLGVLLALVFLSGCGGAGPPGNGGSGGAALHSSAVGPVAGRPLVSMPSACEVPADAGVTCVEVATGEANVCGIDPAAGYYGCCCGTMVYGVDESGWAYPIPGGPADPCATSSPGEAPHYNCIEVPVVEHLSTDPRYVAGTISVQLCGAGGSYDLINEQATACCCY